LGQFTGFPKLEKQHLIHEAVLGHVRSTGQPQDVRFIPTVVAGFVASD
jgi:hypothetical protein